MLRACAVVFLVLFAGLLAACEAARPDEVVSADSAELNAVSCARRSTGTAYVHGEPAGEVVLYDVAGQPMEAAMLRRFRQLMTVVPAVSISPAGATVFRSLAVQTTLARETPALAATPGWSNHQNGHAVDLSPSTLPDAGTLACFGFARPYALDAGVVIETPFGRFARRRYGDDAAPPGKTIAEVRAQVASEIWHYELDDELAADRALSDPACASMQARARSALGGDGSCDTTISAVGEGCESQSLGRGVSDGACVYKASDRTWNRCVHGDFDLAIDADACGAVPCSSLPANRRGCPLTTEGRATDSVSSAGLCAREGTWFPSSDSTGGGAGRDWRCAIADCPPGAAHCWR